MATLKGADGGTDEEVALRVTEGTETPEAIKTLVSDAVADPTDPLGVAAKIATASDRRGQGTSASWASLPNTAAVLRSTNDNAPTTLGFGCLGSSVSRAEGTGSETLYAPIRQFATAFLSEFNKLGNVVSSVVNGGVNGSVIYEALTSNTHYANMKAALGAARGPLLLAYGMNDGFPASYHAGQTFSQFYPKMVELIEQARRDGFDPIVTTSPHPHTGRVTSWALPEGITSTYPAAGVMKPDSTQAQSVISADWAHTGTPIPVSYRHVRVNEAMRQAAIATGAPLIDVEKQWWRLVAAFGQDDLFNTGEVVHPDILGHEAYRLAIVEFIESLSRSSVHSGPIVPKAQFKRKTVATDRQSSTALVADANLVVKAAANKTYRIRAHVPYQTPTTTDIRLGLSFLAGASGRYSIIGPGIGASGLDSTVTARSLTYTSGNYSNYGGNTADAFATMEGIITTGATGGDIALVWGQEVSTASNTSVLAGAWITLDEVA
ncbi:hypothetical protein [Jatrophihabitans sp.]|uniref:hypothetical protein n=1 Tax=Jatrophihabitans sp. TaxID=1932789 RepID=UPI0030C71D96